MSRKKDEKKKGLGARIKGIARGGEKAPARIFGRININYDARKRKADKSDMDSFELHHPGRDIGCDGEILYKEYEEMLTLSAVAKMLGKEKEYRSLVMQTTRVLSAVKEWEYLIDPDTANRMVDDWHENYNEMIKLAGIDHTKEEMENILECPTIPYANMMMSKELEEEATRDVQLTYEDIYTRMIMGERTYELINKLEEIEQENAMPFSLSLQDQFGSRRAYRMAERISDELLDIDEDSTESDSYRDPFERFGYLKIGDNNSHGFHIGEGSTKNNLVDARAPEPGDILMYAQAAGVDFYDLKENELLYMKSAKEGEEDRKFILVEGIKSEVRSIPIKSLDPDLMVSVERDRMGNVTGISLEADFEYPSSEDCYLEVDDSSGKVKLKDMHFGNISKYDEETSRRLIRYALGKDPSVGMISVADLRKMKLGDVHVPLVHSEEYFRQKAAKYGVVAPSSMNFEIPEEYEEDRAFTGKLIRETMDKHYRLEQERKERIRRKEEEKKLSQEEKGRYPENTSSHSNNPSSETENQTTPETNNPEKDEHDPQPHSSDSESNSNKKSAGRRYYRDKEYHEDHGGKMDYYDMKPDNDDSLSNPTYYRTDRWREDRRAKEKLREEEERQREEEEIQREREELEKAERIQRGENIEGEGSNRFEDLYDIRARRTWGGKKPLGTGGFVGKIGDMISGSFKAVEDTTGIGDRGSFRVTSRQSVRLGRKARLVLNNSRSGIGSVSFCLGRMTIRLWDPKKGFQFGFSSFDLPGGLSFRGKNPKKDAEKSRASR